MDKFTVYIDVSPEISSLFQQQSTSVEDLIQQSDSDAELAYGCLKLYGDKTITKDIVPIIIATSAGLSALLIFISNLLKTYFNRPHFYTWNELEEVRENDKIVRDSDGNPLWKIKQHHEVIYPDQLNRSQALDLNAGIKGIVLRISSSDKK